MEHAPPNSGTLTRNQQDAQQQDAQQVGAQPGRKQHQHRGSQRPRIHSWSAGRKNISRACDLCKTKKIRCSGGQPCVRCTQHRLACQYNLPHLRGRQPHRAPYVAARQVNAIDTGNTGSAIRSVAVIDGHNNHFSSSLANESSPPPETPPAPPSNRLSPTTGVIDNDSQYLGPTAGETFISRAWRRVRREHLMTRISPGQTDCLSPANDDHDNEQGATRTAGHEPPLSQLAAVEPPPITRQRVLDLVRHYFDVSVISFRFLSSSTVTAWVDTLGGTECSMVTPSRWHALGPYKSSVLFIILATSLHYQEVCSSETSHGEVTQRNASCLSKAFLAAGKRSLKAQGSRHRLETVQARLAYSIHLLANAKLEASWYVLGRTVQVLTALGMHRGAHEHPSFCGTETEQVRRCFWTTYTLDRYVSIILGRPRLIFDGLYDQPYPQRIDDDKPDLGFGEWAVAGRFGLGNEFEHGADCSMDAPYYLCRLAQIMGEISFQIYPIKGIKVEAQFDNSTKLTAKLMELWDQLPPSLGTIHPDSLSPSLRRRTIELRISFNHAIVLANRPFLLVRPDVDRRGSSSSEQQVSNETYNGKARRGVQAARTVVSIWEKVAAERDLFGAYWIVHHAVFSAVSVLYLYIILGSRGVYGSSGQQEATSEDIFSLAQRAEQHLASMVGANRMCTRYCSILEELRQEATKYMPPATHGQRVEMRQGSGPASNSQTYSRSAAAAVVSATPLPSDSTDQLIADWDIFDSLISFNPDSPAFDVA